MKLPVLLIVLVLLISGLSVMVLNERPQISPAKGIDMAKEIEALMQADRDFDLATAKQGVEGWVSFFAKDGSMVRSRLVTGHDAIREVMTPFFADPATSLRWTPVYATVAASGDLGYTHGTYVLKGTDAENNPVVLYGRYVSIWKKENGRWRVAIDLGTPGQPTPPEELPQ